MFNFFRHYKSPPFHTHIRIHLQSIRAEHEQSMGGSVKRSRTGQKPGEQEQRSNKTVECEWSEEQRVVERERNEERAQLSAQT